MNLPSLRRRESFPEHDRQELMRRDDFEAETRFARLVLDKYEEAMKAKGWKSKLRYMSRWLGVWQVCTCLGSEMGRIRHWLQISKDQVGKLSIKGGETFRRTVHQVPQFSQNTSNAPHLYHFHSVLHNTPWSLRHRSTSSPSPSDPNSRIQVRDARTPGSWTAQAGFRHFRVCSGRISWRLR